MIDQLWAGDWVEIKSLREIAQTLDRDGTLEGLPFMPEMMEWCGRRLPVLRQAEKTCIELPGGYYENREFHDNDVLTIQTIH